MALGTLVLQIQAAEAPWEPKLIAMCSLVVPIVLRGSKKTSAFFDPERKRKKAHSLLSSNAPNLTFGSPMRAQNDRNVSLGRPHRSPRKRLQEGMDLNKKILTSRILGLRMYSYLGLRRIVLSY